MSEVTKLYENAGVLMQDCLRKYYCVFDKSNKNCIVSEKCKTKDCVYLDDNSFTAEKQIKIIEWLGNSKAFFDANETIFSLITNYKDKNGVVRGYEGKGNSVDSCLASLINDLWQDLTEAEKAQIKEILE